MNTELEKISEQIVGLRNTLREESMKANPNLMQEINGYEVAKRAIEVAAVRGHSIGFLGGDSAQRLVILAGQFGVPAFADKTCPCGNYGSPRQECKCTVARIRKHQTTKAFGLVKGADLVIEVVENYLTTKYLGETFETVMARVLAAREFIKTHTEYKDGLDGQALWKLAINDLNMQFNQIETVKAIALSCAALNQSEVVRPEHVCEAIQYGAMVNRMSLVLK